LSAEARAGYQTTNQVASNRRYWVLGTVLLVQFTSVLTSTIVSTAAPTIVDELHGLNLYAWIFTAYFLASSVTVPVVGKLSDLFGRRPFYIGGLLIFLLGSIISGLAQNMYELIGARALTGVGGGAMMALSVTTLGDIFSPRERSQWPAPARRSHLRRDKRTTVAGFAPVGTSIWSRDGLREGQRGLVRLAARWAVHSEVRPSGDELRPCQPHTQVMVCA